MVNVGQGIFSVPSKQPSHPSIDMQLPRSCIDHSQSLPSILLKCSTFYGLLPTFTIFVATLIYMTPLSSFFIFYFFFFLLRVTLRSKDGVSSYLDGRSRLSYFFPKMFYTLNFYFYFYFWNFRFTSPQVADRDWRERWEENSPTG